MKTDTPFKTARLRGPGRGAVSKPVSAIQYYYNTVGLFLKYNRKQLYTDELNQSTNNCVFWTEWRKLVIIYHRLFNK